jgi:spectinomycin phosphotransferase
MLEKPDIPDELIISRLQQEYDLAVTELTFLPLGVDENTAVYRVLTKTGAAYFLKLRKNFDEIIVRVPLLLQEQGIQAILVPFAARSGQRWADFDDYKILLYPFIAGKDSFGVELSDRHKRIFGAALKSIHTTQVPAELKGLIPKENYSPHWRELLKSFQTQVENNTFTEPTAAELAGFMRSRRDEIRRLLERTEELADGSRAKSREFVLCHTDVHGANILLSESGELYIVDWDNPLLAPKERDLMFIGSGVDGLWKSKREEAIFYQAYGETEIDLTTLAYYRYARIIEDLAVICQQLFLTDAGGADREQAYQYFTSNFAAGNTLDVAKDTDRLSTN